MATRTGGKPGFIAAAGLCLTIFLGLEFALTTPLHAESDPGIVGKPLTLDQYFKHKSQTTRKASAVRTATHKDKPANAPPRRPANSDQSDTALRDDNGTMPSSLPDSVANANAKLSTGNIEANEPPVKAVVGDVADAVSPPIEIVSGVQIASADQLNDIDRASMDDTAATSITPVDTGTAAPQLPLQGIMSISSPDEAWRHVTLIGKIMVAFGLMLVAGSTIRMIFA